MALIHRQVKKSTLGKIVNNHPKSLTGGLPCGVGGPRVEGAASLISYCRHIVMFIIHPCVSPNANNN